MKRRKYILMAALVVVVIGGVVWVAWPEPPEPVYRGKGLTAWLETFSGGLIITDYSDPPTGRLTAQIEGREAIRAVGTNGIPILLRMAGARDSSIKSGIRKLLSKQSILHFKLRTAGESHELAFYGFLFLGPVGKPAIPQLIVLLNDSDPTVRQTAAASLGCIGSHDTNTVLALVNHLSDPDGNVRIAATNTLVKINPKVAAKAGVK